MTVTIVHVEVKPEHVDDFIKATTENHLLSVKESGNLRFDVLQLTENPLHFALYEAFATAADAAAHKETAHYLDWRVKVADWMARPREGIRYLGLLP